MKRITNFFAYRWHRMVLVFGAGTLLASLALAPKVVEAAVPKLINFQGILKDGSGNPVVDGSYSVTFKIYAVPSGGTALWTEVQPVTTSNGLFAVILGSSNPVPDTAFKGSNRWLGIAVSPDPEMLQRQQLVSVGYAYRVNSVDSASGGTITSKVSIGQGHINTGIDAFVAGANNRARGMFSVVSGGGSAGAADSNSALGDWSAIGGGSRNTASGSNATVGGGFRNTASGTYATVGGGSSNTASTGIATVGGGQNNVASGLSTSTVGGGLGNTASGLESTVGGGNGNSTSGAGATVAGGLANIASGFESTVGGGALNKARGDFSVVSGGGGGVLGDSNSALGDYSTVPGGRSNLAAGAYSFAAGRRAKATHAGSFVWADSNNIDFASSASAEFNVRASGGTRIYSNSGLTAGVTLAAGASAWVAVSDSTLKRNIRVVDGREMLDKVMQLPIKRWSYKAQDPSIEHIGPMAQDFYPLFKVGDDEKTISTIDPPSIALAAIQGLYQIVQEQKAENKELRARNENLSVEMKELKALVQKLLAKNEGANQTYTLNNEQKGGK